MPWAVMPVSMEPSALYVWKISKPAGLEYLPMSPVSVGVAFSDAPAMLLPSFYYVFKLGWARTIRTFIERIQSPTCYRYTIAQQKLVPSRGVEPRPPRFQRGVLPL